MEALVVEWILNEATGAVVTAGDPNRYYDPHEDMRIHYDPTIELRQYLHQTHRLTGGIRFIISALCKRNTVDAGAGGSVTVPIQKLLTY
jgi:hypothetical protein